MNKSSLALIERLTLVAGPSGFEKPVGDIIREHLASIGSFTTDPIGNIVCEIPGTNAQSPRILLAAHQDEIAFMVSDILDNGFLHFIAIGGWNPLTLPSSPVEVIANNGKKIPGIIGQLSPHFLKKGATPQVPQLEELCIDIGASSAEEVRALFNIQLGALVLPVTNFSYIPQTNCIISKAFDDRIGVATLIELGQLLVKNPIEATVILAFTVQEEVGTRGAKVLANYIGAEAAIVVEGAPADDIPGGPQHPQTCIGKGAHVRIFDPTHIGHPKLLDCAREAAKKGAIPIQETVRKGGGTDAMILALAGRGIPSIVTGVPVRYAHSHNCLISLSDYHNLILLLHAICRDMGKFD
ncbi:MAG: M20/M25/M40 family metallo-hydrolase [Sphaerochaetaceae bacterium]|jgi:endoglucanase|nr:M20/M25/M40 family metallo-hydrolase [Sphaerochaetaceae bacterium]